MSDAVRVALGAAVSPDSLESPGSLGAWAVGRKRPDAVVHPTSVEEVQGVLRVAAAGGFGVVPLGSMVDVGCEPAVAPFAVMAMDRITGIEDYEAADLTVTARAGMELGRLSSVLAEQGQWLPCDPPGAPRRTWGGLVATGASGALATAYGPTRDHVLGVTVVTGDGRVLHLGGRVMKNVAGFDLVRLMVGSRGTLGVIVSATLRVFPLPEEDRALVIPVDDPRHLKRLAKALRTAPVVPASVLWIEPQPGRAHKAEVVVRLQGARDSVDVEEQLLLRGVRAEAERHSGDDATAVLTEARDAASQGEVVLRLWALPSALFDVVEAAREVLHGPTFSADLLSGRVRASVAAVGVNVDTLARLRRRLDRLGGDMVLERAPKDLVEGGAYPHGLPGVALSQALRQRFDPQRVLSVGRFS